MIVGIYNPYHDTLGGGEQYLFSFASYFLPHHTVIYFSPDPKELKNAGYRFGIDLSPMVVHPPIFETGTLTEKIKVTRSLDILLFYSDGSIPVSFAKKTYLIFQFPVPWVKNSLTNKLKFSRVTDIIVNSHFTKNSIDKTFSCDAKVIYPAINVDAYRTSKKEKLILSVGRFTKGMNTKRHDVLIDAFKEIAKKNNGWRLVLAGGVQENDWDMVKKLHEKAEKYPIEILPNIDRDKLLTLYAESSFYWHAAGYGVDEEKHPELVEHFGITTLEALASGAIPLVYSGGGQKEIIANGENGELWQTIEELCTKTTELIKNPPLTKELRVNGHDSLQRFSTEVFTQRCRAVFGV